MLEGLETFCDAARGGRKQIVLLLSLSLSLSLLLEKCCVDVAILVRPVQRPSKLDKVARRATGG